MSIFCTRYRFKIFFKSRFFYFSVRHFMETVRNYMKLIPFLFKYSKTSMVCGINSLKLMISSKKCFSRNIANCSSSISEIEKYHKIYVFFRKSLSIIPSLIFTHKIFIDFIIFSMKFVKRMLYFFLKFLFFGTILLR